MDANVAAILFPICPLFAHAADDHTALDSNQQVQRLCEPSVERTRKRAKRLAFGREHTPCSLKIGADLGVGKCCHKSETRKPGMHASHVLS